MKAIVVARRNPSPVVPCQRRPMTKATSVNPASITPCQAISQTSPPLTRGSFGSRGGSFMTPGAEGSSASARAGKTSVTMFSHRIWSGPRGSGQPIMMATKMTRISAVLQEKR